MEGAGKTHHDHTQACGCGSSKDAHQTKEWPSQRSKKTENSVVCHARAPQRGTVGTGRATSDGTGEDAAARCSMMSACASTDAGLKNAALPRSHARARVRRIGGMVLDATDIITRRAPTPSVRLTDRGHQGHLKRHKNDIIRLTHRHPDPACARVLGVSSAATLPDGPLCQFSRYFTSCFLISAPWAVVGQSRAWPRWAISPSYPPSAVACGWAPHHRPSAQPSCPS